MFIPSLRFIGLPLLARKPIVVNHYTWFPWRQRPLICALQKLVCRLVTNVAPSQMLAQEIGVPARMMPNPFDSSMFRARTDAPRTHDLVFLGRVVEEKGADILLNALAILRDGGLRPRLTVIGKGDATAVLQALSSKLGLADQVRWVGPLSGKPLAQELARHKIMVVPSRWREPFGIVALEGLASGCRLVVADNGGLLEAAGPHGIPFAAGDPVALAGAIRLALTTDAKLGDEAVDKHLARFSVRQVTLEYEQLFSSLNDNK
jgi:glycosyltransferase involved in cell wall biosynthesis